MAFIFSIAKVFFRTLIVNLHSYLFDCKIDLEITIQNDSKKNEHCKIIF